MSPSTFLSNVSLTATIPTDIQVPYTPPSIPTLLSLSTFLVLLALPTLLSNAYPVHMHRQDRASDPRDSKSQSYTLDASLTIILPLLLGALFGPSITSNSILSSSTQISLINIGYIGLLLLIFEAGVSLDAASLKLMRNNAALSVCVALTGALVPIATSMGLGLGAYGYSGLQSFASGASLASTSLGTTLALLAPPPVVAEKKKASAGSEGERSPAPRDTDLRRTRVGCVLVCAALLDDILGLVIAGIIPGLAQTGSASQTEVKWPTIVRPVFVSAAFGLGTPLAAMSLRSILHRFSLKTPRPQYLFIIIILSLMAFLTGSGYAGTSELFGAYLAGAFMSHIFPPEEKFITTYQSPGAQNGDTIPQETDDNVNPVHAAFVAYLQPILTHLLAPLFFGSIGAALPIKAMFTTHPNAVQIVIVVHSGSSSTTTVHVDSGKASHAVIWRGVVYAVLMILSKMVVGLWMLIWPVPPSNRAERPTRNSPDHTETPRVTADDVERAGPRSPSEKRSFQQSPLTQDYTITGELEPRTTSSPTTTPSREPSRTRSALLLGLAMVARGEIALIVAQLARPLLIEPSPASATSTSVNGGETTSVVRTALPDEEPFAVVIWAILVSTVGGAVAVGMLVASWKKRNSEKFCRANY